MKVRVRRVLFLLVLGLCRPLAAHEGDLQTFRKIRSQAILQAQLAEIVATGIERAFGGNETLPESLDSLFQRPAAVFVTLKKGPQVRGCMGTLQASEPSLAQEIQANLRKAMFQDPWHRRVQKDEILGMEIYLTAVGDRIAVRSIAEISPLRDGVYIRQGGKEAVVLPGEAKTQRYLLAFLKTKAGIQEGPYQLFRMRTETIRVDPTILAKRIVIPAPGRGRGQAAAGIQGIPVKMGTQCYKEENGFPLSRE